MQQSQYVSQAIQIVDQREYQENCEKIIEANASLQDAINLTSRTPITPITMVAGVFGPVASGTNRAAMTNEHSSCQSFYKLDESISRVGGYAALASGTH